MAQTVLAIQANEGRLLWKEASMRVPIGVVLILLVVCCTLTWVAGVYYGRVSLVAGAYEAAKGDGVFIISGDGQSRYVVRREGCAKSAPNCFSWEAVKSP